VGTIFSAHINMVGKESCNKLCNLYLYYLSVLVILSGDVKKKRATIQHFLC